MVITLTAIWMQIYHVRLFRNGMNPETDCSLVLTSWKMSYGDNIDHYSNADLSHTAL